MARDTGLQLINALAANRERMIEMALRLRENTRVATAESGIDVRKYETGGTRFEAFVDAELNNGHGISWWLEFRWEHEAWVIEASINETGLRGQRTLREIGTWTAGTEDQLIEFLNAAVGQLIASVEEVVS